MRLGSALSVVLLSCASAVANAQNLVQNPGFEGFLAPWTSTVWFINGNPHSGSDSIATACGQPYCLTYPPTQTSAVLAQTLTTMPGQTYTLSFWIDSTTVAASLEVDIYWGGSQVSTVTSLPNRYIQVTVPNLTATSNTTVLQFLAETNSALYLDDVSVTLSPVASSQVSGLYLDLENISPNNVLGTTQQAGGLFVQGGFVCATSPRIGAGACGGTVSPVGGYQTVIYNSAALSFPDLLSGFAQYSINSPPYSSSLAANTLSFAYPVSQSRAAPLTYANGGDQIGFTLATNAAYYNITGGHFNDVAQTPYPDLVGTPSITPVWGFDAYDSSTGTYIAADMTNFLTTGVNCNAQIQAVSLLNCNGQLAPIVGFPSNVSFSLSTQANNLTTPTFQWTQPSGYTPDVLRMEIWQINGAGVAAAGIFSTTLPGSASSYTVPATFTNLTTGQTASLQVGQDYAIDIENITLRNPANPSLVSNDNIWSRSRSFFDFTPEPSSQNLPPGTPIQIPVVNSSPGATTYEFNQTVTAGSTTYIDPAVATGYVYQTGAGDPNFTSVTPISSIGSGVYQLYVLSNGSYVFLANVSAGQTYTFAGTGVSNFEITGIPASANVDPANTSAFITGLTFAASGHFTGTMTPLTTATGSGGATDGPLPLWALMGLGAGLLGIASRRLKHHRRPA